MPEAIHVPLLITLSCLLIASLLTLGIVISFYSRLRRYTKKEASVIQDNVQLREQVRYLQTMAEGMVSLGSMRCFVVDAQSLEMIYQCGNIEGGRFSKVHSVEIFAAGMHEDDRPHFLENCRKLLSGSIDEFHEEYRYKVGKDYRRMKEFVQRLPAASGEKTYLLLLDMDVNDLAERTLRWGDAEQLLTGIFADAPGYIFLKKCTDNFPYTRCNSTFAGLFGLPPQEVCGKTDEELLNKDMVLRVRASNLEALRSENVVSHKWYFTAANDRQVAMMCVQRRLHCSNGIDYILGMGIDVSGMEHVERNIRRNNQLLRTLVDALPCELLLLDKDCNILTGNNAMVKAFGVPVAEMRQHRGTELDSGFGELDPVKLAARDQQPHTATNDRYQVTALPLTDESGEVVNYAVWRTWADTPETQENAEC